MQNNITLKENERIEDLNRRGYRIIQNTDDFRFGIDSTFLASFAKVKPGEKVMDLCSGTGIVMILMDARNNCGEYTGLEISSEVVEMATRSIALNHIEDHMRMEEGDVKMVAEKFPKNSFDVLTVNPPYMPKNAGLLNPNSKKAIARHEILCTLSDVIKAAAYLLKPEGRFYMIHRPSRLGEIFHLAKEYNLSPDVIQMIHPHKEDEATMVLVSMCKGAKKMLHVAHPLIIYKNETEYTDEVLRIYRE